MAVEQPIRNKVRPAFNIQELNVNFKCRTGDGVIDIYSETLHDWQQTGENVPFVDLKSAYLQLSIDKELWTRRTRHFVLHGWDFG